MEPPYLSINRWINEENVVHVHFGILFGYKEKWKCDICKKIEETSKVLRKTNTPCFISYRKILCVWVCECVCLGDVYQ